MTSAKSSLKESSLLFRAFFSGLDIQQSNIPGSSMRSLHRESVALWEQTSPGLVNPELVNMFDTPRTNKLIPPELQSSPRSTHRGYAQTPSATASALGSRLFDTNTHVGSQSSVQGTIALALSAAELDVINGRSAVSDTPTSYGSAKSDDEALAGHSKPAIPAESIPKNINSAAAFMPKTIATLAATNDAPTSPLSRPQKTEIEDYATDCAIFNTIKQPLTLRVVNVDADSDANNKDRAQCQSPDSQDERMISL
ncbi:hypothetical protein H4R99_004416 [Coemansia sp. RSA 1722]|nr:hypothetical protein H4R99_004416 [Coemansia sp. RSA 1722]